MSRKIRNSSSSVLILFLMLSLAVFLLSGCSGGGAGGGGGSSSSTPATTSAATTTTPSTTANSDSSNKGVLITITKADKSVSAVLVGVSDYMGTTYDLPYAANDPVDLKDALTAIPAWVGSTVSIQSNVNVTKSMIQTAVTTAVSNTASGGLFVFSFSGNGTNSGDTGYLMPYYTAEDYSQLISEDELRAWLNDFPAASKKLVILDSSVSGLLIDKSTDSKTYLRSRFAQFKNSNSGYDGEKFAKSLVGASNTYVMAATNGSQAASELADVQNGTLTYYVCNGFAGSADSDDDNVITAEELAAYAFPLVSAVAVANGGTQSPQSYDNYAGSLNIKENKCVLITIAMPDNSAYAVIATPTNYPGSVNDLNCTGNDAMDLKNSIEGSPLWSGATITVQNNVDVTKAMIQNAITTAKNTIANDGLFLFMYSGHGTSSGATGYLVTYDGASDNLKRISEDDLKAWLDAFNVNVKKYILLDSCYSGNFIDKSLKSRQDLKPKVFVDKDTNPFYSAEKFAKSLVGASNTYVMTASSGSEYSYESPVLQNGVFIYYVAQGLGSGAAIGPADANSSLTITAEELGAYTPALVTAYASPQHPQTYDNFAGDLRVK